MKNINILVKHLSYTHRLGRYIYYTPSSLLRLRKYPILLSGSQRQMLARMMMDMVTHTWMLSVVPAVVAVRPAMASTMMMMQLMGMKRRAGSSSLSFCTRAVNGPSRSFTISAQRRPYSLLKAPTHTFTNSLLQHYAKQAFKHLK